MSLSALRGDLVSENEKDFIRQAILEGKRLDGRGITDFRALKLTFGREYGQVQVQLGRTRVYAMTACEVVPPQPERPTEGFFTFNVNFSPMSSAEFDVGRQSAFAVELGRVVERGLRESRAIDTEALCIVAGEKVWSIRVDIHVLDHGGNLTDACSIGAIASLFHFRRPDITIGETVIIHSIKDKEPVPLSIHHMPLCITFGLLGEGDVMVVDPLWKEEQVLTGRMTLILNIHKELCGVQKAGGVPLLPQQITKAAKIAMVKVKELTVIIQDAIQNDLRSRDPKKEMAAHLMVSGIGTSDLTKEGGMQFHDGLQAVGIQEKTLQEQVIPTFTADSTRYEEFEAFAEKLAAKGVRVFEEDEEGDKMDVEEEEGEEMLQDEFA